MMRIIKDNDELKSLIDENNNIVINDSIICDFNIDVEANIIVQDIIAWNIIALNINARDIIYFAVCVAYNNINCNSIKGRRNNCKHFVLDGKINIKGVDEE